MILEKLLALLSEAYGYEEVELEESTVLEDLAGDTMELEDLILAIEGEFEVDLSDEDCGTLTLAELADCIEDALSEE